MLLQLPAQTYMFYHSLGFINLVAGSESSVLTLISYTGPGLMVSEEVGCSRQLMYFQWDTTAVCFCILIEINEQSYCVKHHTTLSKYTGIEMADNRK